MKNQNVRKIKHTARSREGNAKEHFGTVADKMRILLFLIAVVFIVTGIMYHQPDTVLAKAIRICLECVGIG